MGNKIGKKKKEESAMEVNQAPESINVLCPICNGNFSQQDLNQHIIQCQEQQFLEEQMLVSQIIEQQMSQKKQNAMVSGYLDIKIPIDDHHTKFAWQKIQVNPKYNQYVHKDIHFIKRQPFVAKYVWLRHQLGMLRSDGSQESKIFSIDCHQLIQSSLKVMRETQTNCEVKVQMGQQKTQDAGGLTREWLGMLIKKLCCEKQALFTQCQTSESLLKLKVSYDNQDSIELVNKFRLFGFILAKSLIETIPLESQLCWPLLRQIFKPDSLFQLEDLFHYDQQLYRSLSFIRQYPVNEEQVELYFTYQTQKGIQELIEGGKLEKVTNKNKQYYLFSLLKYLFKTKQEIYIHAIRSQLFRYVPKQFFTIFELYEIEMLINGRPFIDIQQWKNNTQYKGQFHEEHQNVKWFWEILSQFEQSQLSNLMKFISGSTRLGLQGFEKLSCNRGKSNKFELCPCSFISQGSNSYPKGFTCFNRLMLPMYPLKQLQKKYLKAIVNSNFQGVFGLQ